jgi:energy-coupling factor transport system permease protein
MRVVIKQFQLSHPSTPILTWIAVALALPTLKTTTLLMVAVTLLLVIIQLREKRIISLIRRTRWVLLTLLIVYAYATPGESAWTVLGEISPTQEGLSEGLLQILRLLCALASLSILLALMPQSRFVAGLYTLAYPLRLLGVSRDRFAVRLALTLEFAETAMRETANNWKACIDNSLAPPDTVGEEIELLVQSYGLRDIALLIVCATILAVVWR